MDAPATTTQPAGQASAPERASLAVLQSAPVPRPTTNPYIVMLCRSIAEEPGVTLLHFSWRTALTARYDVFHVHWPEYLVAGRTPLRRAARQTLTALFLARLAARRVPVVQTVHNVGTRQVLTRTQRRLLAWCDRLTVLRIRINDGEDPAPAGGPSETIVHGHYRDWFADYPRAEARADALAYVGTIRAYKGVDRLLSAFDGTRDAGRPLTLTVSGAADDPDLRSLVVAAASSDPRITATLEFVADADFVLDVTSAELVVLPYREMHNSGGALATLSLDRPVLVPDNDVNARLAEEMGPHWVQRFSGELGAEDLLSALDDVRALRPGDRPDMSRREWSTTAADHVRAYRRAISLRRGTGT